MNTCMHTNVPGWWEAWGASEVRGCQGCYSKNGGGYSMSLCQGWWIGRMCNIWLAFWQIKMLSVHAVILPQKCFSSSNLFSPAMSTTQYFCWYMHLDTGTEAHKPTQIQILCLASNEYNPSVTAPNHSSLCSVSALWSAMSLHFPNFCFFLKKENIQCTIQLHVFNFNQNLGEI